MFGINKSPAEKYKTFNKKIYNAIFSGNEKGIRENFEQALNFFLENKDAIEEFKAFLQEILPKIANLKVPINYDTVCKVCDQLVNTGNLENALSLCDAFSLSDKAFELLSKQKQDEKIVLRVSQIPSLDKTTLSMVVSTWEKYNGSFTANAAIRGMIIALGQMNKAMMPDIASVKELIGSYEEAAVLYEQNEEFLSAGKCYESIGNYSQSYKMYLAAHDNEGISRSAEGLGNYEEALKYTQNNKRYVDLLVKMERYEDALRYASSFIDSEKDIIAIKEKAKALIQSKIVANDYVGAFNLATISDAENDTTDKILQSGREYYKKQIAKAIDIHQIEDICKSLIKLEELSGNYAEAGQLAEKVIHDQDLASFLYEKGNLYDKAIRSLSETDDNEALDNDERLAELHEKGGNLLEAAKLYEKIKKYEKASALYEKIGGYDKAAECYSQYEHCDLTKLAELYEKAGLFENAIAIYIESNAITDLEKAKKLAQVNNMHTHESVIDKKIAAQMCGSEEEIIACLHKAEDIILQRYSLCVGIDFGTTNSVGAVFNKSTKKTEIVPVPGKADEFCEPSFFGVDENNRPVFGENAKVISLVSPKSVIARIKRSIGQFGNYLLGGRNYKAEEISAMIINRVKNNAVEYLTAKTREEFDKLILDANIKYPASRLNEIFKKHHSPLDIEQVVLTVPAYYNDNQKRSTRDAAEVAGLKVLRLLHEPTAAALAYGYSKKTTGRIAVVDLGGGTLDISILEINDGVYEVVDTSGDIKLGGSDIDVALLNYVCHEIKAKLGIELTESRNSAELTRLRDACENAKMNLSYVNNYTIELRHFIGQDPFRISITREILENVSQPVLNRIKTILSDIVSRQNRVKRIDHYLLVGNATKMPAVDKIVRDILGNIALSGIDPGTIVSSGAALSGAILNGFIDNLLIDIVPYSLGVLVKHDDEPETISRMVEKGSIIPITFKDEFTTTHDNQDTVRIKIYQGESMNPDENYSLGEFELKGILAAPKGVPKIEVTFDIGADCILTVTAKDLATAHEKQIRVEGAARLSPNDKNRLKTYFDTNKRILEYQEGIEAIKERINNLVVSFDEIVRQIQVEENDFREQFKEKVETNAKMYSASASIGMQIQEMFLQKDSLLNNLGKYIDRVNSARANFKELCDSKINYNDEQVTSRFEEKRIGFINVQSEINTVLEKIRAEMLTVLTNWNKVLQSMTPDYSKMSLIDAANSCVLSKKYDEAKQYLLELENGPGGLTKEAFNLLLECSIRLCNREEYYQTHKKYGYLFGFIYPDFNRLDAYLSKVSDSIVMIYAFNQDGLVSGSGFAVKKNLIITNKHVINGISAKDITIIGKDKQCGVEYIDLDPANDIAALIVKENFIPLRVGEFNFVSPGEQVIAIGFPQPDSSSFKDNLSISKGIINSIRRIPNQSERVIFMDAKINSGNSGGPLINELGEVVGINTMVKYSIKEIENSIVATENQAIALSSHLIEKYL